MFRMTLDDVLAFEPEEEGRRTFDDLGVDEPPRSPRPRKGASAAPGRLGAPVDGGASSCGVGSAAAAAAVGAGAGEPSSYDLGLAEEAPEEEEAKIVRIEHLEWSLSEIQIEEALAPPDADGNVPAGAALSAHGTLTSLVARSVVAESCLAVVADNARTEGARSPLFARDERSSSAPPEEDDETADEPSGGGGEPPPRRRSSSARIASGSNNRPALRSSLRLSGRFDARASISSAQSFAGLDQFRGGACASDDTPGGPPSDFDGEDGADSSDDEGAGATATTATTTAGHGSGGFNAYRRSEKFHRRHSRRCRRTSCRRTSVDAASVLTDASFLDLVRSERFRDWASSFRRLDPRYQILTYFNDVARDGGARLRRRAVERRRSAEHNTEKGSEVYDVFERSLQESLSPLFGGDGGGGAAGSAILNKASEISPDKAQNEEAASSRRRPPNATGDGPPPASDDRRGEEGGGRASHRHRRRHRRLPTRDSAVFHPELQSPLLRCFDRSSVFTVWRPCSADSLRAMMRGDAVGKGPDVKGKSARGGALSGYVPFVQIHDERDKVRVRDFVEGARMRVFYKSEGAREAAAGAYLRHCSRPASSVATKHRQPPRPGEDEGEEPKPPPFLERIDGYARCPGRPRWGIAVDQSRFWAALVLSRCLERPPGSGLDTGRPSEPAFQDMNLVAVRSAVPGRRRLVIGGGDRTSPRAAAEHAHPTGGGGGSPHPAVLQSSDDDPLDPRTLLMAYEEGGRVLPVVSDLDCLIVGTRRVWYDDPLPADQVRLVRWCVDAIASILDEKGEEEERAGGSDDGGSDNNGDIGGIGAVERERTTSGGGGGAGASWTQRWLEALKREGATSAGGGPYAAPAPPHGYGDPTSYAIMEHGIERFAPAPSDADAAGRGPATGTASPGSGAVRHGAECFNYAFPQELDRDNAGGGRYLVVSDALPGRVPWSYVSEEELRALLIEKIDAGFTFPLHPKWVLCDPGWGGVYDRLLTSDDEYARRSVDVWFPAESGVRERIAEVRRRHPGGFVVAAGGAPATAAAPRGGDGAGEDGRDAPRDRGGVGAPGETAKAREEPAESGGGGGRDGSASAAAAGAGAGAAGGEVAALDGTAAMDLAEQQLRRFLALGRAKRKLRAALLVRNLGYTSREKELAD